MATLLAAIHRMDRCLRWKRSQGSAGTAASPFRRNHARLLQIASHDLDRLPRQGRLPSGVNSSLSTRPIG